jgi:hypothetical protein
MKSEDETEKTKTFAMGLWANFEIDGTRYSLALDENPFFDAYFIKSRRLDDKRVMSEYAEAMNDIIYKNAGADFDPETMTRNLHKAFGIVKNRKTIGYVREQPFRKRDEEQTIYEV